MKYVLIDDHCGACQYISNAFTLLRLPLDKVAVANLSQYTNQNSQPLVMIACKETVNQHKNILNEQLNTSNKCLISLCESAKVTKDAEKAIYCLNESFSQYDLNNTLFKCSNYLNHLDQFISQKHAIFDKLVGQSSLIRQIKMMINQVAYSDSTVLILGQSGTGKDVIASCIHHLSARKDNPLVPINCGAIPGELMESELFGHEKGAFTGALTRRPGRFEIANTGTLFLDEIGDMPLSMQVKLLRVIQDRQITRVGGNTSIDVDVRLIAATNKHLSELISRNQFREDLFYRLNVFPINVPSLHERQEDIPLIIEYHLDKIYERLKHRVIFTENAKEILCKYNWPGNIRELQNFLERMVILHPDCIVDEKDIDASYKRKTSPEKTRKKNNAVIPA